jgi:hypothetical protein
LGAGRGRNPVEEDMSNAACGHSATLWLSMRYLPSRSFNNAANGTSLRNLSGTMMSSLPAGIPSLTGEIRSLKSACDIDDRSTAEAPDRMRSRNLFVRYCNWSTSIISAINRCPFRSICQIKRRSCRRVYSTTTVGTLRRLISEDKRASRLIELSAEPLEPIAPSAAARSWLNLLPQSGSDDSIALGFRPFKIGHRIFITTQTMVELAPHQERMRDQLWTSDPLGSPQALILKEERTVVVTA